MMMKRRGIFLLGFVFLIGTMWFIPTRSGAAEVYPTRPINLIVPFPPGGNADLNARPLATALEKILKQPISVINKSGAGGATGMQFAARSKPDGYTLMVALVSICFMPEVDLLYNRPSTYKREDFAPIARLTADPMVFVVKQDAPWKSLADVVADAKRRPNEIKYSSSGVYGVIHIGTELFTYAAGIKLSHLPTAGGAPALTAFLGGHVETLAHSPIVIMPHIKSGVARPLASFGKNRLPALPDIPTLKELGYDVEFYSWAGLFAPKDTPPEVIKILRKATRQAVDSPEFKTAMNKMQAPIAYLDADEFQKFWYEDYDRLAQAIRKIGKID